MARGLDFTSLTRAERSVLASGGLLFADGLIPWWYRAVTPQGTFSYNAGLTGLGAIAVLAGAVAAVAVLARAAIWPEPAPRRDGTAYAGLGLIALIVLVVQLARTRAEWIGIWVAIVFAIALVAAGLRRRVERRAGWV